MYENDDEQKAQNKRWYLAQCKPNATHIAIRNLDNQGFASFLPLQEDTKRKGKGLRRDRSGRPVKNYGVIRTLSYCSRAWMWWALEDGGANGGVVTEPVVPLDFMERAFRTNYAARNRAGHEALGLPEWLRGGGGRLPCDD